MSEIISKSSCSSTDQRKWDKSSLFVREDLVNLSEFLIKVVTCSLSKSDEDSLSANLRASNVNTSTSSPSGYDGGSIFEK